MGQTNAKRIEVREGSLSYISNRLASLLKEIDQRLSDSDLHMKVTYGTTGLLKSYILKTEFFLDAALTRKMYECLYSYSLGFDTVQRVVQTTTIFYNVDGSEDSRIVHTYARNTNNVDEKYTIDVSGGELSTTETEDDLL